MKKLNMNEPGAKMAGWIIIFLAVIPAALWANWLRDPLRIPIKVSLVIGSILAVVLLILVMVELKQDRLLIERYQARRHPWSSDWQPSGGFRRLWRIWRRGWRRVSFMMWDMLRFRMLEKN